MLKNINKFKPIKWNTIKRFSSKNNNVKITNQYSSLCIKQHANKGSNIYKDQRTNKYSTQSNTREQKAQESNDRVANKKSQNEEFNWDDALNLYMELKIMGDRLGYHWQVDKKYLNNVRTTSWAEVDPIYVPMKSWTYNFRYLIINFSKKKIFIAEEPLGLEGESLREMLRVFTGEPIVNGEIFYLSKLLERHSKLSTEESDKEMQNMFEHINKRYTEKKQTTARLSQTNALTEIDETIEDSNFALKSDFFSLLTEYLYARGVEKEKDEVEKNIHPLSEAYSNSFLTNSRAQQMRDEQWYEEVTQQRPNLSVREKYNRLSYSFAESDDWYQLLKDFNLDVSKFPFYSRVNNDLNPRPFSDRYLSGLSESALNQEVNHSSSSSSSNKQSNLFDPKASLINDTFNQGNQILSTLSVQGDLLVHDVTSEDGVSPMLKELRKRLEEDELLLTQARKLDNIASLHLNQKKLESSYAKSRSIRDRLMGVLDLDFVTQQKASLLDDEHLWKITKESKEFKEVSQYTDLQQKINSGDLKEPLDLIELFVTYARDVYPRQRLLSVQSETSPQDYQLLQALSNIEDVSQVDLSVPPSELTPTLEDENRMMDVIKYNLFRDNNVEYHTKFLNKFNSLRLLFARRNARSIPIPSSWVKELKEIEWPSLKSADIERIRLQKRVDTAEKLLN